MGHAVKKLETETRQINDPDEVSRLTAEIEAQQQIIHNFRTENRRLEVLLRHSRNQNDDLTRSLGLLNARVSNLPPEPAPLIPRRSRQIEDLDPEHMKTLLESIENQGGRIETHAYTALGYIAHLVVQAVIEEDPVPALEFHLMLNENDTPDFEDPDAMRMDIEKPPREIVCSAISSWLSEQFPDAEASPQ